MKKTLLLLTLLTISSVSFSQAELTSKDFQALKIFMHVYVEKAELVFRDELVQEDVYQVTYSVEGDCAPAGEVDACELVPYCEYVKVDNSVKPVEITGTQVDCSENIEEVIGDPGLIDEL